MRTQTGQAADVVLVSVAVPEETLALTLSTTLLEAGLAACCQTLGPVRSQYMWQGKLESATEFLLLLKTRQLHLEALETCIRDHHPYEVPEILVTAVSAGHAAYLDWVASVTPGNSVP